MAARSVAGYVINLGSGAVPDRLGVYAEAGIYGTSNLGRVGWYRPTLYTLADYVTMTPGELIFFFQKRIIYGIGCISEVEMVGGRTAILCNFPQSYLPSSPPGSPFTWDGDRDHNIRWRVIFRPTPHFFRNGVDMDEVLESDIAGVTRSLRVFSKRSFVKLEDDEADLVATMILRQNQSVDAPIFVDNSLALTRHLQQVSLSPALTIDCDDLVVHDLDGDKLGHEPTLHAWLADQLTSRRYPEVIGIFGSLGFVTNLYPASPLKPREYMDELDIFGYTVVASAPPLPKYVDKFKVIEVKKDRQDLATPNVIDQVMKYVDWVGATRAGHDYSRIDAFVVAHEFSPALVEYAERVRTRSYVVPRRPYHTRTWASLALVQYRAAPREPAVSLEVLLPAG